MKQYSISKLLNSQGLLVCPVCKKEFKPNDDTKYLITSGYTCGRKCFYEVVKKRRKEKEEQQKLKEKR
jgi:hypothetical protein